MSKKVLIENRPIESHKRVGKNYFIEGIFIQADIENGNGRKYPAHVLEKEVENYYNNFIRNNNALGQLNHPKGEDATEIDLTKVSHLVTDLRRKGNNWYGRAKILSDTPCGQIAQGLLDSGVKLGVSTRGVGSIQEANGVQIVADDYVLIAIDIVQNPSAPQAFVEAVVEEKDWLKAVYNTRTLTEAKKKIINEEKKTIKVINERDFKKLLKFLDMESI